jgi:hypothetical protein
MDDVHALFALFAISIFSNVFDQRTYMPFLHTMKDPSPQERIQQREKDLNAVPLLDRRHHCYTRGLAFDLLYWFLNRFSLAKPGEEDNDAYNYLLTPFTADLGRLLVKYKFQAEHNGHSGVCSGADLEKQVKMALFAFDGMQNVYDEDNFEDSDDDMQSFAFDFDDYEVKRYDCQQAHHGFVKDFFEFGKNKADQAYFDSLKEQG